MKVTGEVHHAVSLHMGKSPRYTLNRTVGGRHRRSGSCNRDKFLVRASNPVTSSRLPSPIPVTIKTSLWNAEKDHTGPACPDHAGSFFCLPRSPLFNQGWVNPVPETLYYLPDTRRWTNFTILAVLRVIHQWQYVQDTIWIYECVFNREWRKLHKAEQFVDYSSWNRILLEWLDRR